MRIGLGFSLLIVVVVVASCADDEQSTRPAPFEPVTVGARASFVLEPVTGADASTSDGQPVSGSGVFRGTRDGVDFTLSFLGCVPPTFYAARLYDASDCASALSQVGHGALARDGVPKFTCNGTTGFARVSYSRPNTDPEPWTIADQPSDQNVAGKILVLETRDPPFQAFGCGKVRRVGDESPAPMLSMGATAELAGFCTWKNLTEGASATCPDVNEVASCTATHCELAECAVACADHVACVDELSDPCTTNADGSVPCPPNDACTACEVGTQSCMVSFCLQTLACGPKATPGGPCTKLEECCSKQGDYAERCLDVIRLFEQRGGDINCSSAMNDWDFVTHLQVPCTF